MVALMMAAACSSGPPTTALRDQTASSGPPGTIATTVPGFQISPPRLTELAEAGLEPARYEYPPQPEGIPWPTEEWDIGGLPVHVDADEVDRVVDMAFTEVGTPENPIQAVLVVHGGQLVVEEYHPSVDRQTLLAPFSISKSFKSALVGILVGQDQIDIFAPAPVPEWADPADPRHEITLDQLLRMSSGLDMNDLTDKDALLELIVAEDQAAWAASRPLAHDVDTEWAYATGTSSIVERVLQDTVGTDVDIIDWADEVLYDPLGMDVDHTALGAPMSAQDFARFGLLYLRGGVWEDEQLLPEGWVDYSVTQTPTLPSRTIEDSGTECCRSYGLFWWLDHREGAFHANGANGQAITVVPRLDLVVVILSNLQNIGCQEKDDQTIECGPGPDHHDIRNAIADTFEPN
jgi:CubicO group peptidase (beta-lactamase class C family)